MEGVTFVRWLKTCQWIVVGLMVFLATGFVLAQSQDYLNAQYSEQIRSLVFRVDNIEGMIKFVLAGVFGTLGVQLINLRQQAKHDRHSRMHFRQQDDQQYDEDNG